MSGEKGYLELIKDDTSKIMKCQGKIKELLTEMEETLANMHTHTVKYDATGGCFGVSVSKYLEIERLFYDNMLSHSVLNDTLSTWFCNCSASLKNDYSK